MSKESLGFVRLEWTCPQCDSRNPGPEKTCLSCGAPQPDDVEFVQAAESELISDEAEIERAKAGADIHCGFCGARNPAGAAECAQCGADLTQGAQRKAGRVVGAFQSDPVAQIVCSNCGTENPETALKCAGCGAPTGRAPEPTRAPRPVPKAADAKSKSPIGKILAFGAAGAVILCLIVFIVLSMRTDAQTGIVQEINWATVVHIEAQGPVEYETWRDDLPAQATPGVCRSKVHHVQDEPAPDANKVCGTPYTKDTGTGHGEVVQDCRYEVMADWCEYTVLEWLRVSEARLNGADLSPKFAEPALEEGQRLGTQEQSYTVVFATDEGRHTYNPDSLEEFRQFQPGSEWILNINTFGAILSVEPAR